MPSSLFPRAPRPVLRVESDDESTNRVAQLAMRLGLPGGAAVEKMVAQGGVGACGEHQASGRFGLGGGRHPPELLLGAQIGRDHGSRARRSHGTLVHHVAHTGKQLLVGEERAYERRDPEMEGERALQNPLEVFLHGVLPDLQGKAMQHVGKIAELMQHYSEDQLGLVAEMIVERALGDVRRTGDVARRDAAQALRGQESHGCADEFFLLIDRRGAGSDAGCNGPGHAGSGWKSEFGLSKRSGIMSKRSKKRKPAQTGLGGPDYLG